MKVSRLRLVALFWLGSVLGSLGVLGVTTNGLASAQSSTKKSNSSQSTLKISPVRTEITAKQGESVVVPVFITNVSKVPVELKAIENDFVAGDEKGTPSLILDEKSFAQTHSLKKFMVPIPNVTVDPGVTKQVDVTVKVAKDAQAGGFYGALRFAPLDANGDASVSLSGSVSSLILLTVPGDLSENLTLTNFDIQQKGTTGSNFRNADNLEAVLRFENKGNVHVAPFGQINVKKGDKVVYKVDFNGTDPKGNVLPDSARKWNVPLEKLGKFGKYKIVGTFTYGSTNKAIEVEKTIWIVPTFYIIAAGAALVGLIALIVFIRLFLRSYKKKVLRGHRR